MRFSKIGLIITGFVFLLLCLTSAAEARVSWGLSIGTSFGYPYPGYYPCDPWYNGYYTWLDRDRYVWWDSGWYGRFPRRHYWPGRSYSSVGVWLGDCRPSVIGTSVLVSRSSIGSACSKAIDPPKSPAADTQMNEAIRKKKSEQLKVLKIGDKEKRIEAIHELAAFASDNQVRQALEKVLLSDPDPELRKEVAVSLGKTENLNVLAALTQAKENDPDRDVRQAAYRSIIMIKGY